MFTGIATLGLISGTLASMFRRDSDEAKAKKDPETAADGPRASATTDLRSEMRHIQDQLDAIERSLSALAGGAGGEPPAPRP